jgi:hypothetical protein
LLLSQRWLAKTKRNKAKKKTKKEVTEPAIASAANGRSNQPTEG